MLDSIATKIGEAFAGLLDCIVFSLILGASIAMALATSALASVFTNGQ